MLILAILYKAQHCFWYVRFIKKNKNIKILSKKVSYGSNDYEKISVEDFLLRISVGDLSFNVPTARLG